MRDGATSDVRTETEYDVVVVGGGPAGCSTAVFTARYGLDTVVFDRGRSSIQRCAHLENYLGFPAGIDVETLYGLMHDHVREAGGELVSDLVDAVSRSDRGFVVETEEGRRVTTRRVVAATRYDGEYLRPLGDEEMFETSGGGTNERFDRTYPESDGTTPFEGLYVASPSEETDRQAIVAAGRGARVGLAVVRDVRRTRGVPDAVAPHYDWLRREATLDSEWDDRDRWREWYDAKRPDGVDDDRWEAVRERDIDRRRGMYLSSARIDRRRERGQRRLLDHVDDDLVVQRAREIESGGGDENASGGVESGVPANGTSEHADGHTGASR
ncbi:thioredoxin reductase [Salinigranum rubrum]|uniref:Thioredoxin reductase n=1 Tax=Salinigranum rubrum TaxID=755307 RepID=A0A2I8VFF5_9EURY|nr:FAD-dependent oxidoreductase [Salinigranum rubrum]AUV80670.1 thioredoxin reductase [Salinigranum rubrum]